MYQKKNSELLFIYPEDPEKSILHQLEDNFGQQEKTLQSIVEAIEKEKQCYLEFTDFFGIPVPRNLTPTYFKGLQPFYITKMISRKEVNQNGLRDKLQIFVTTLEHHTLTIHTHPWETISEIKMKIKKKEDFSIDDLRLEFGGKPLEDHKTLTDYDIKNGSTLNLQDRLKGGSLGVEFVDITQENKATIQEFTDKGPKWRTAKPGLILQGKCCHKKCEAFGEWVVINKGMITYDQIHDEYQNNCPMCSSYVMVEECGFSNCLYTYSGVKVKKGSPPERVVPQKEMEVGNHYKSFDPKIAGKAIWTELKILTKKIGSKSQMKEASCGICRKEVEFGKKVLDCSHLYHKKCLPKIAKITKDCARCHF